MAVTTLFLSLLLLLPYVTASNDVLDDVLDVFLVPHTHADLCWKDTMQGYFDSSVHSIYDTVVSNLVSNPDIKFNVAEIGFFRTWWEQADQQQKQDFRGVLNEGRLEFVGGGYSQPDEAANDGPALVRNMMNGHAWIESTFGESALPTVSWSLDPFGQTPTAMSLFKQMGFTSAVIDRIPYSTKDELVDSESLEFMWKVREFDEEPKDDDLMFTHVLHAYYHFGRDGRIEPEIDRLYWGPQASDHTDSFLFHGVERAAKALARQVAEQSIGQRHNKVMVLFGKDFAFQNATQDFAQMNPLVDWINKNGMSLETPMRIRYATASEYFDAVRADTSPDLFPVIGQLPSRSSPTTTASFIPYVFSGFISERMFGWWSGFFFSRPALKSNARAADALLSAAESISIATAGAVPSELQEAVDISGLMTHHDALPGTSLTPVTADLYAQLREGAATSAEVIENSIKSMFGWTKAHKLSPPLARGNEHGGQVEEIPSYTKNFWSALTSAGSAGGMMPLALVNPLIRDRIAEIISIPVPVELARSVQVISDGGGAVEQQVVLSACGTEATLYFSVDTPALSVSPNLKIKVGEVNPPLPFFQEELLSHSSSSDDKCAEEGGTFAVEDDVTTLLFSSTTGNLCSVNGKLASLIYGAYTPLEDDPWVFRPRERGFPKRIFERTQTRVVTGAPLVNYAVQELQEGEKEMHLSSRFVIGGRGDGIEVTHFVGNETNVISDESEIGVEMWVDGEGEGEEEAGTFKSDTNGIGGGLQMRKIRDNLPLPANFFPLVRLAAVGKQVLMVSQSHAVSSLRQGGLMVMLHRRLARGGLFEGGLDFVNDPLQDTEVSVSKTVWRLGGGDMEEAWEMQARLEEPIIVLWGENEEKEMGTTLPFSIIKQAPPPELRVDVSSVPGGAEGQVLLRLAHTDPDATEPIHFDNWFSMFAADVLEAEERTLTLMGRVETSKDECGFDAKSLELCVAPGRIRTLVINLSRDVPEIGMNELREEENYIFKHFL